MEPWPGPGEPDECKEFAAQQAAAKQAQEATKAQEAAKPAKAEPVLPTKIDLHKKLDSDGDGYISCIFDATIWQGSTDIVGGEDCDDSADLVNPGADELCATTSDDDCDGVVDSGSGSGGNGSGSGDLFWNLFVGDFGVSWRG